MHLEAVAVVDEGAHASFDLVAVRRRQVREPILALVPVGEQVGNKIERRQEPSRDPVAHEVFLDQLIGDLAMPADIERAAKHQDRGQGRNKIKPRRQHDGKQGDSPRAFETHAGTPDLWAAICSSASLALRRPL
jgi:hypothetical protein